MNNLKAWMKVHDMTHQQVADKLGVSREYVTAVANSTAKPNDYFLGKFFRTFGAVETDAAFPQPQEA